MGPRPAEIGFPSHGGASCALAGLLAWGGTVHPDRAHLRWVAVAVLAAWGVFSLLQRRERSIEHVYAQVLAAGLASAAVGWLIPGSGSRGLVTIGGLVVLASLGLLIWSWFQRRHEQRDDTNRPR